MNKLNMKMNIFYGVTPNHFYKSNKPVNLEQLRWLAPCLA